MEVCQDGGMYQSEMNAPAGRLHPPGAFEPTVVDINKYLRAQKMQRQEQQQQQQGAWPGSRPQTKLEWLDDDDDGRPASPPKSLITHAPGDNDVYMSDVASVAPAGEQEDAPRQMVKKHAVGPTLRP